MSQVNNLADSHDRYEWFSVYLQRRGLTGLIRAVTAVAAASMGLIPVAMMVSKVPPRPPFGLALAILSAVCGLAGSTVFALRWPTKNQSRIFSVIANAGIACACLAQSNPDAAIHACTGFAVLAGYIALFHAAPLMAYNFFSAMVISVVAALRLASSVGAVAAGCAFMVVVIANLAAPFGIQIMVRMLGADVARGDYDPLTGLLTRSAFLRDTNSLLESKASRPGYLSVAVVDLDRFKRLNDNRGHAYGDEALVSVAAALRNSLPSTVILGRMGGEEFIVAGVLTDVELQVVGQTVCTSIAALRFSITASVGTATMNGQTLGLGTSERALAALIARADEAMYEAKRAGGNQSRQAGTSSMPSGHSRLT